MTKFLLLFLLFTVSSFAQLERNSLFRRQGAKVVTKVTMLNYAATREILYYIPRHIDLQRPTTVVIYLHGGNSRMTQERATDTADTLFWGADGPFNRKEGIKSIADNEGFIVVMPTTTTGWNDFTSFYLKELLSIIRKELNPDPNRIYLTGHSMGAMGICRSAGRLADEFSMFMPFSGGFQPHLKTHADAGPLFNTKVFIASGEKYEFPEFVSWNLEYKDFLNDPYTLNHFKVPFPDWEFQIHSGTHNPNIPFMARKFTQFLKTERNIYQANLFGTFFTARTDPTFILDYSSMRYFWLESKLRKLDQNESALTINFRLYSQDNVIDLYVDRPIALKYDYRAHIEKIRLHLSEKLFDLDRPLIVNLITKRGITEEMVRLYEGKIQRDSSASEELIKKTGDEGLKFEAFLDLVLLQN